MGYDGIRETCWKEIIVIHTKDANASEAMLLGCVPVPGFGGGYGFASRHPVIGERGVACSSAVGINAERACV